ncbi:peptide ABC transporter substrate-binding protein [Enterococcus faecalis]|uniref:peptide ABC transporter substrate-binding protein n=1 Tax=Enterococcus TaxID=1350 RepID=UPI00032F0164|nr:peptide ABC transporter substrate-binding protein [Enterococcus faecalis]EGO8079961.1 peptide ABC transporter substrate-binding protein [Enterococcus faecalis]EJI7155370.1 peptide ABC transporter substrate-binding protein [Enterococcus faecalis]ELU9008141.1 peptide ABC transporter substrate-binding protein [Enterococcus faecalis]EOJ78844.1 pheromone-binding protein [Enterococcus faecalis EnGen0356]MDK0525201.1 peptide ABC transporter substrate-binding protein [Enterococcus faecalis]
MKKLKMMGIMLFVSTVLVGCGTTAETKRDEKTTEKTSVSKKVLNLMDNSEIGSMDSIFTQDEASINAQSNVFEGLYQLDEKDQLIPAAAKEMPEISEDGKRYTIKLREDGKWSNGDAVTANDFVFAWRKLANPKNQANYFFLLEGTILNGTAITKEEKAPEELGVKALDDYTLEVTLEKPVPYFTSLLAFSPFFPQNEAFVKEKGQAYGTSSEMIVSNGPFLMKNWDQSAMSWDFVRNPDYYDKEKVKSETIHFEVLKETNTVYNLYESGELDVAVLTGDFAKQNRDNPDYEAIERSKVYSLRLNQKRNEKPSIFANENVRKALAYALDKKSLVDNILADGSKEIYGYIPEKFVYNPETNEDFRQEAGVLVKTDAKKAKEYLDKAKAELNGDVAIELLSRDGDSDRKVAEFIQGQLQETLPGLTINVKTVPLNNAIELMRKGDYELSVGMWGPDYQDPMTFLESSVSGNRMNYSSPTFDQLIEEATTKYANDPETRWQTLIKAEKVLVEEDAALIPLYQEARSQLIRPGVKGIQYHNFGATSTYKYAYKE